MIIRKIDINSIFPIIIKIIKLILDDVSKFAKFIFPIPNISDVTVFVTVKIDNLNEFSNSIPLKLNREAKIKREIINIRIVRKYLLIS